jgi:hypothetical protein
VRLTKGDRLVIATVVLLAALSYPAALLATSTPSSTVVIDGPRGTTRLTLDHDGTHVVEGLRGHVVVEIDSGRVRVIDADCPEGRCVASPAIDDAGRAIVCLPNAVTVSLGRDAVEVDHVLR